MKNLLLALGALVLLALPTAAPLAAAPRHPVPSHPVPGPPAPPRATPHARTLTPDEQLFTGLVEQVGAAVSTGDMAALGKFMAPDYVHYTPDNRTGTRAQDLAYVGSWSATTVQLVSPVRVTRRGDLAVTVATSTYSGQHEGKPFQNRIQMMIAWVLRDGHWQMAVVQSKVLPA
ncbi:nuclear transport factor 2 family protein [Hymenobacter arizonensis]|uniref:DUF4440 domain-containing protein n=1 Tax=Hymenobacter arizonensis TaxID=1227077 RepID=A0A1I6BDF9_HYMAR|nr:nuclear transport factor 2 family protein [Hymenobacter arizonensis]SFQ78988.1 protein of unknown function [Hymenobacter arizonensis]